MEFAECPGLRLTAARAARFWGLDRRLVDEIVEQLVRRARCSRARPTVRSAVFQTYGGTRRSAQ